MPWRADHALAHGPARPEPADRGRGRLRRVATIPRAVDAAFAILFLEKATPPIAGATTQSDSPGVGPGAMPPSGESAPPK
jgi:hypothetical protein